MIGKHFAHARLYDDANGRMLALDPVRRDLNGYRYCDDDPVNYADPTGEVLNIIGGAVLGGVFGGAGGFIGSAISQKLSGEKVDWKKAWGAAANGAITGAVQGGLVASGAGIPVALASNFLAGTAGSAAEQYISEGKIDARKSITSGLTNAVSNAIYGTDPLKGVINAAVRGAGAGAATAGINYISDFIGQKPEWREMETGFLTGMAGKYISSYGGVERNPRRGCENISSFVKSTGYSLAKGYRYKVPGTSVIQKQKKFDFGEFLGETVFGGVVGGFTSAGFYGAGKGIEKLKDGFRASKSSSDSSRRYYQVTSKSNAQALLNSDSPALKGTEFKEVYVWTEQPTLKQAKNSGARYLDTVIGFETNATFSRDTSIGDSSLWDIARVSDRPGPITISKVVETGFRKSKRWWQFWKK